MPSIIYGDSGTDNLPLSDSNISYDYPNGLDLRPGSKLHDRLKNRILERARESANVMSTRYTSWNEIDKFLTVYKRIDQEEKDVQSLDDRKPVSIVFPYSYAILETLLSYMTSAFFRFPIFRYEGYSPEDVIGAILLEQVVNLHVNKFKCSLNLHTMFRDGFSYGIGPILPVWKTTSNGLFSGNALENIDPYKFLPDTTTSIDKIQDSEFVGWIRSTNLMDLLSEENNSPDIFNVKYLKRLKNRRTSIQSDDQSARNLHSGKINYDSRILNQVDEIPMYIKLIPKEWELGDREVPEKWFFRLAGDEVIITARSADFRHDKFPITVSAPDFDGYSSTPLSRLEILSGLQGTLDWLFNSHITNVRKAVNDVIIYDPYSVNGKDIKNPKPGKLIRLRRPAWGKGVKDVAQQLVVNDITKSNIQDSSWIVQWMQKIGATDDAAMGSLRQGGPERLTSAEYKGTNVGAVSRLERIARVIGLQAMQDIGEFFAAHTQQMMDEDAYVKITGNWTDLLIQEYGIAGAQVGGMIDRGRLRISPDDLNVQYDVVVRDGSIPGGNYSEVWMEMFKVIAEHPELAQKFDITRIFSHIARNSGAKNVEEFKRRLPPPQMQQQAQMMPDEQLAQQLQAGNVIPMNQGAM